MKASIIVSDTISQNALLSCIHLLCTQEFPRDQYEVILPDLGKFTREEDIFLKWFQESHPHLSILQIPGKNRAELLDAAARRARGKILLFIESHCLADKHWLAGYVSLFAKKKVKAALGNIKTVPTKSAVGNSEEDFRKLIFRQFGNLGLLPSYYDFHNVAITKECFERIGGLAHELPTMCEFDLGARLHQAGIQIHKFPENWVWHINDSALASYSQIVQSQGKDRTRILYLRGPAFLSRYFPTPALIRMRRILMLFRRPLIILTTILIRAYGSAFKIAHALGMHKTLLYMFGKFANYSHIKGILTGLKK